ncbi:hypothetical protein Desaci_3209 [Desulfosporosinus acidiphilus SJ4]|uniref:Uncharacterized protein n=1 Tax=Desulfosporosinus acidiphilus (strain DSM 22704 / JCM 16185 / SJ4) TaxID=646529 RepID=I4D8I6_DESAJ|nr:hypothetical protein [Desulfosporosinus acidiphilus]AFM42110.1 hypothetical protein Desaci_3209 [Desulfosporosinus acidiphilus SJ4]
MTNNSHDRSEQQRGLTRVPNNIPRDIKYVTDGVDLLTSILTRYPELGAVHYWCERQALKFTFMFKQAIDVESIQGILRPALEFYHHLERRKIRVFDISCRSEENIGVLHVVRDIESVSQREVGLMIELLRRNYIEEMIYDEPYLPEEELEVQEEVINQMLTSLKHMDLDKNVIALRDEGRVLVFNN